VIATLSFATARVSQRVLYAQSVWLRLTQSVRALQAVYDEIEQSFSASFAGGQLCRGEHYKSKPDCFKTENLKRGRYPKVE
jgi:hypothetical protein